MVCFYLQGTVASKQRQEQIFQVLHGQEQHLTPGQYMAREEEAHVEAHVEQTAHVEQEA
jgi:hypothetical protein